MNNVRQTAKINEQELQLALSGGASWHDEYKDSAYIFIGGLPRELTEGDVITIFSQYGEVLDVNLPRDKSTGKKRGFGFLMYEDQRSTVLAVDNLNGAVVLERTLRVDHVREYRQPGERDEEGNFQQPEAPSLNAKPELVNTDGGEEVKRAGQDDEEESDLDIDLEDPMAEYLARQRREGKSKPKHKDRDGTSAEDKEAKRRRKEERRRIREERERRKAGRHSVEGERERKRGRTEEESLDRARESKLRERDGERDSRYRESKRDAERERERERERDRYSEHERDDGRGGRRDERDGRRYDASDGRR